MSTASSDLDFHNGYIAILARNKAGKVGQTNSYLCALLSTTS